MMKRFQRLLIWAVAAVLVASCGMSNYPGQEGRVTNGYSKIDFEYLDDTGLWAYEVNYDNRNSRASRVGAVITKLYPGAQTYTSNARTNADGTLYWHKGQYQGAQLQMISTPKINQVIVPPDSQVVIMLDYAEPMDEIDDQNIAEKNQFSSTISGAVSRVSRHARLAWNLLRAGSLLPSGAIAYDIVAVELDGKKFQPATPVRVTTNFAQNAVRTTITAELKNQARDFLEANFPKGFQGEAKLVLKDSARPVTVKLGLHTLKTARAAGVTVLQSTQAEMARRAAALTAAR